MKTTEPLNHQGMQLYLKNALRQLLSRNIILVYCATMAVFILLYGVIITAYPFYLEHRYHASPSIMGLILGTASLATIFGAFNLGRIVRWLSLRQIASGSFLLYTAALGLAVFIDHLALAVIPVMLFGLANGINIPAIQAFLSGSSSMEYRGVFMAVNAMVLRIGQTLGPLLAGVVTVGWGIDGVLYAGIAFSLVMFAALAALFIENTPATGGSS